MKRPRSFVVALAALAVWLVPLKGNAQQADFKIDTLLSVDKLSPNARFRLAVVIDVGAPWHINANPVSAEGLIPTTLTLQPPASVVIDRIVYPKGETTNVTWNDEPVALYTGRTILFAEGHVDADAKAGPVKIEGSLRYQACNDRVCIAPKNVPVALDTEIVSDAEKPQAVHTDVFGTAMPGAPLAPLAGTRRDETSDSATSLTQSHVEGIIGFFRDHLTKLNVASLVEEHGWLIAILVIFAGGLALNLTPCVYPMIAITVSYFGGQAGERSPRRAFISSLIYCLGIVLTYSTLGLMAGITRSVFGSALQSPVVLIGIALLLIALALSMFGLYELQPPQFLMQKATGLSSKAGFIGVFFLGAVIGIIAAPCLAPVVVALLAFVAKTGNPWLGWWLFFIFGLGLGLPYVVLGTFSGLLTRLPKSGKWMVWVKRVFGTALVLAAALITSSLWFPTEEGGIVFEPYSTATVQQATAQHRPVFVDFSAEWCGPCRKMERTTFHDKRILDESKGFTLLKADLTHEGSPDVEKLRKNFGIWGVPTLVFIGPDGREHTELRRVEYVTANELLDLLAKAKSVAPTNSTAAHAPDIPPQLLNPF